MKTKSKKKKLTKKKIDKLDIILLGVMALLGLLILYLGFKLVYAITHKDNTPQANIVIPVLDKNTSSSITLTMSEFKKDSVYIFKVNNYRNNDINKEKIKYTIEVLNEDETNISIFKNDSEEDLAQPGSSFKIEENKLKAKEKQTDLYQVKLKNKKNVNKNSQVTISIES